MDNKEFQVRVEIEERTADPKDDRILIRISHNDYQWHSIRVNNIEELEKVYTVIGSFLIRNK